MEFHIIFSLTHFVGSFINNDQISRRVWENRYAMIYKGTAVTSEGTWYEWIPLSSIYKIIEYTT